MNPANGRSRPADSTDEAKPLRSLFVAPDGAMLVDVRGAARLIGISPGSLYRMISARAFPEGRGYPGIEKRKAWRVDDVVAWVDEHFPARRTD